MSYQLEQFLQESSTALEVDLRRYMPVSALPGSGNLNKAIAYALFPGGKRMRPLFTLLAAHTVGGNWRVALPAACTMEYLHASSLILDDLPCMDNALERRGRDPVHVVYGESTAILAAISLLNRAWSLLSQDDSTANDLVKTQRLISEASVCIGVDGVIAGQYVDLATRAMSDTPPESLLKTTTMTRLMMTVGVIVGDGDEKTVEALGFFGQEFGAAYQLLDDVIDSEIDALVGAKGDRTERYLQARDHMERARNLLGEAVAGESSTLLMEYTMRIYNQMFDRARTCLSSQTPGISTL